MKQDPAVSSVISEVLLIALVLILVPIVTISLMNQLPEDRVPTVTIIGKISPDGITFSHKGGDYIKKEDIRLIVRSKTASGFKDSEFFNPYINIAWNDKPATIFDLGSVLTLSSTNISAREINMADIQDVTLIAKKSVIYLYQINR